MSDYREQIEALADEARQCFSSETEASLDAISKSRRSMTEYIEVSRRAYAIMLGRLEQLERELHQEKVLTRTLSNTIESMARESLKGKTRRRHRHLQTVIGGAIALLLMSAVAGFYADFTAPYKPASTPMNTQEK